MTREEETTESIFPHFLEPLLLSRCVCGGGKCMLFTVINVIIQWILMEFLNKCEINKRRWVEQLMSKLRGVWYEPSSETLMLINGVFFRKLDNDFHSGCCELFTFFNCAPPSLTLLSLSLIFICWRSRVNGSQLLLIIKRRWRRVRSIKYISDMKSAESEPINKNENWAYPHTHTHTIHESVSLR